MDLGGLSAGIFSPSKVAYYGFMLGLWFDKVKLGEHPNLVFLSVTALFLLGEVFHNDYWRIRLNARARKAEGMPPG